MKIINLITPQPMSKSEELKKQAQEEENDFKAMGLLNGSIREGRQERFMEVILPKLLEIGYDVALCHEHFRYSIDTDTFEKRFGIVDYYPKANNLCIRKQNKWIKPGNKWIADNLY